MRIESLSIKSVTAFIVSMIGVVAILLSIFAGDYFKRAALNAQMNSLSRVLEVASEEMLKEVRKHSFDLGMKLGHSDELMGAINNIHQADGEKRLITLLDDPFINGFVGFSNINLEKIRIYALDLNQVAESSQGIKGLEMGLPNNLIQKIGKRQGIERLKAIDTMWIAPSGPMHSTLVPVGGLRLMGYIEIIVDPSFNLPEIGEITKTPISAYTAQGDEIFVNEKQGSENYLPIQFVMYTSEGKPAFRIVGYENVENLIGEMSKTQIVTISGFLVLSFTTLVIALWLFQKFLFLPLKNMISDMEQMADGRLDLQINKTGLREFYTLTQTFNSMANKVRMRTNDLERLLDLDETPILCFASDNEAVYFNETAASMFGYEKDEITDLDLSDLFKEDVPALIKESVENNDLRQKNLHARLTCKIKDADNIQCEADIRVMDVKDDFGYAIVLAPVSDKQFIAESTPASTSQSHQRMDVIEQSLNDLLEIAKTDPAILSGLHGLENQVKQNAHNNKAMLREQAVNVMCSSMACWEHDLNKTKLKLAEESKIWPVYIDKSTPTTRTLDKYLHIDSCPKNPRCQRVVDTAEFVLKQIGDQKTSHQQKLVDNLQKLRNAMSGV